MDKLRAIEYFVRVVAAGSFSAAARQLEVSPPAVSKLIKALECELGTTLLHRDSRRVVLTADGDRYLQTCARVLVGLREAESEIASGRTRASGKLVVGLSRMLGPNCLMPFLPEFLRRYPDIEVDVRAVNYPQEPLAAKCDVLVLRGGARNPTGSCAPSHGTVFSSPPRRTTGANTASLATPMNCCATVVSPSVCRAAWCTTSGSCAAAASRAALQ